MARTNTQKPQVRTHEGGFAMRETPLRELRRTLSTCLLFENTFYESGDSIANRLATLAGKVSKEELIAETLRAKQELKLRHAPLWMARHLTRLHQGRDVGDTIAAVITRADELAEFVAMYWREGKQPLSKQAKRGLSMAFQKFDEYQFAKYDRDYAVKLRDVMFMTHPKPTDDGLFKRIAERELTTPDTWEVNLSAAKGDEEKRAVWERLLQEEKLGALALIRNLRNMDKVDVPRPLVKNALSKARVGKMLPFQFVAAWRNAPMFGRAIETSMMRAIEKCDRLNGSTRIIVDVSGSMGGRLSRKGDMNRLDAACALTLALNELSDDVRIWTFSNQVVEVAATRGFGLITDIQKSQPHGGTYLRGALMEVQKKLSKADRVIVVTDEQTHDGIYSKIDAKRLYLLNVAPYKYGVDVEDTWTRINGFSTAVVDWMIQEEADPLFAWTK